MIPRPPLFRKAHEATPLCANVVLGVSRRRNFEQLTYRVDRALTVQLLVSEEVAVAIAEEALAEAISVLWRTT